MPMKRFNIWLDTELVNEVQKAGKALGVRKTTYMRMAIVEKLRRDEENGPRNPQRVQQVQASKAD